MSKSTLNLTDSRTGNKYHTDITAGTVSQYEEMVGDSEQRIARPRQIYTGYEIRKKEEF